jgi:hypothetical protein
MVDAVNISAPGGRIFAPQLDLLLPIVIEYTHFPETSWSCRLPVCVGALEIGWLCRDWIVIVHSWLIHAINILVTVCFGGRRLGIWRRFADPFIDPLFDFVLSRRPMDV